MKNRLPKQISCDQPLLVYICVLLGHTAEAYFHVFQVLRQRPAAPGQRPFTTHSLHTHMLSWAIKWDYFEAINLPVVFRLVCKTFKNSKKWRAVFSDFPEPRMMSSYVLFFFSPKPTII